MRIKRCQDVAVILKGKEALLLDIGIGMIIGIGT